MDIESRLLRVAEDDDLGLWEVINRVRNELGKDARYDDIRHRTLEVLRSLLGKGLLVVGNFSSGPSGVQFRRWDLSLDAAIERISTEWQALGTDPGPSDIAYFETPDYAALLELEHDPPD